MIKDKEVVLVLTASYRMFEYYVKKNKALLDKCEFRYIRTNQDLHGYLQHSVRIVYYGDRSGSHFKDIDFLLLKYIEKNENPNPCP